MRLLDLRTSNDGGATGPADWNSLTNRPTLYSYFAIWAEENADVNENTSDGFQWSYGNGSTSPAGVGVIMPFDCELIGLGLTTKGAASCRIDAYRNLNTTGKRVVTNSATSAVATFEDNPVAFGPGDVLAFRTIAGANTSDGGVATAWFRRLLA